MLPSSLLETYPYLLLRISSLTAAPLLVLWATVGDPYGDFIIFIDPVPHSPIPGELLPGWGSIDRSSSIRWQPSPLELLQGRPLLRRLILCIAYSFGWFRQDHYLGGVLFCRRCCCFSVSGMPALLLLLLLRRHPIPGIIFLHAIFMLFDSMIPIWVE